jgi:hypothetical protein
MQNWKSGLILITFLLVLVIGPAASGVPEKHSEENEHAKRG